MRVDDFLSTVGIIKRRTIAKELGASGLIEANGRTVKPAYQVKTGDIIRIKGSRPFIAEVLAVPTSSVARPERHKFFRQVEIDN